MVFRPAARVREPAIAMKILVDPAGWTARDLAADDRILTSLAPGQSEHPGHPHYRDGLGPWLNGNPRLFARSNFLVEENTVDSLRLEPGR